MNKPILLTKHEKLETIQLLNEINEFLETSPDHPLANRDKSTNRRVLTSKVPLKVRSKLTQLQ